jgi:hypothetical protein
VAAYDERGLLWASLLCLIDEPAHLGAVLQLQPAGQPGMSCQHQASPAAQPAASALAALLLLLLVILTCQSVLHTLGDDSGVVQLLGFCDSLQLSAFLLVTPEVGLLMQLTLRVTCCF